MVSVPLQHCNQSSGSSTQSCMQGHYWLPLFHPLLTTPSRGSTPSSKADSRASDPLLLWTCSAPSPRLLQPLCLGNQKRSLSTKEETLLEIILFFSHTTTPIPTWVSDHLPPFSTMVHNPLHCFPLHSRLHRQQYSPTPNCFKPTILPPPRWYPSMDWRFCPLPFRSRWRWSLCYMLQMQHIPFPILFLWSNCLQLHSRNLCPQARSRLVY